MAFANYSHYWRIGIEIKDLIILNTILFLNFKKLPMEELLYHRFPARFSSLSIKFIIQKKFTSLLSSIISCQTFLFEALRENLKQGLMRF
jgi:hypothetical protein